MAKSKKGGVYRPSKTPASQTPDAVKTIVQAKADELIETVLKARHVEPPAEDEQFNYIVDIYAKWHRQYFYFCAKYHAPGPNAIRPYFELNFARLEYVGKDRFNLAYMRHTGQFWELYQGLTLEECLTAIRDELHFFP